MTAIWGSTFFMVKDLVTRVPVADLLAVRFAIAAIVLAVVCCRQLRMSRQTLRAGLYLGLLYGSAQLLQTYGLEHTPASVSGFLTGLYVVLTPILSALILRTRITSTVWAAAVLASAGLAVLSLHGFSIGPGELLTLASAVLYALHIVVVGQLAGSGTALQLSLVQMVVMAVMCGIVAAPGGIQLPTTSVDWIALIYYAAIAGALTMVLQVWAQARVDASRAAIIMAMEPVWATAFAIAFGGESLTWRMVVGGTAILTAMYLVERRPRKGSVGAAAPEADLTTS